MAKNIYGQLVDLNPNRRLSAEKALQHPWITREKNDKVPLTFLEIWNRRRILITMKKVSLPLINMLDGWNYYIYEILFGKVFRV